MTIESFRFFELGASAREDLRPRGEADRDIGASHTPPLLPFAQPLATSTSGGLSVEIGTLPM